VSHGAQLRNIEFAEPRSVIGKTTVEAIQSGVIYGFAGQIDGIVGRMRDELGPGTPSIATGGLAPVIMPFTKAIDHHEPWLTLEGLLQIYERNTLRDED
jgi:type III pantothenate kinase